MKNLKVYLAGKVDTASPFAGTLWREQYCAILEESLGLKVVNLNPSRGTMRFPIDEGDPELIFGRDCFMIRECDLVIVNLTDDISVGGSQEMLIAKYFHKPLIGIAQTDGKFKQTTKQIRGTNYQQWTHPFVALPCDGIMEDIYQVASYLKSDPAFLERQPKDLQVIEDSIKHYIDQVLEQSTVVQ